MCKKCVSFFLTLTLVVSVSVAFATGLSDLIADNGSAVGSYRFTGAQMAGMTLTVEQISAMAGMDMSAMTISIYADGRFSLNMFDQGGEGTWRSNGNYYELTMDGGSIYGAYDPSNMTFSIQQEGENQSMALVFSKTGAGPAPNITAPPAVDDGTGLGTFVFDRLITKGGSAEMNELASKSFRDAGYSMTIYGGGRYTSTLNGNIEESSYYMSGNEYVMQSGNLTLYGQYNPSDGTFSLEMGRGTISVTTFIFVKR